MLFKAIHYHHREKEIILHHEHTFSFDLTSLNSSHECARRWPGRAPPRAAQSKRLEFLDPFLVIAVSVAAICFAAIPVAYR